MSKQTVTAADIQAAFEESKTKKQVCSVGRFLREQSTDVRQVLEKQLKDEANVSGAEFGRILRALGLQSFGEPTISKHRRGDCPCPR